jgi:peptidoglycan/LPS O-acetylase OafA/YrhL
LFYFQDGASDWTGIAKVPPWRLDVVTLVCLAMVAVVLAMPFVGTKECQLPNGIYEAAVILFVFPLIVLLGAGAGVSGTGRGRLCAFLGDISYPLYITHFPLICMLASWRGSHPNATPGQALSLCVGLFVISVFNAWAALKLYDLPVRRWLAARFGRA